MTDQEKRELRVWAFDVVSKRPRGLINTPYGGQGTVSKAPELLELITEAQTLANWAADGKIAP